MESKRSLQLQDPNIGINDLLKRDPSGPDFTQPTINYCQNSITFGLGKIEEVLKRQFPEDVDSIARSLASAKSDSLPFASSDLFVENGGLFLRVPGGDKRMRSNLIVESINHANPELGVFEYGIGVYPIAKDAPNYEKFAHLRHPQFNVRFTNVVSTGELPLTSPIAEVMAVAYITQIAKIYSVEEAKKLLTRAKSYGGLANRENLENHLDDVIEQIHKIKSHLTFVAEGLGTINRIAKQNGLDENQVQLIIDLAFIKGKAFDQYDEFLRVFRPIVRFIAEDNWQEAFAHRDFLLEYFNSSFPEWRQRAYEEKKGVRSFNSIGEVVEAAKNGELAINKEDVPLAYQELFGDILEKKVAKLEMQDELPIIMRSIDISNKLLLHFRRYGDIPYLIPEKMKKGFKVLYDVRLEGSRQMCRVNSGRNAINFGEMIYNYIQRAQRIDASPKAIKEREGSYFPDYKVDAFAASLIQMWRVEKNRNRDLQFSPQQYLIALIRSGKGDLPETDQVLKFIKNNKQLAESRF